LPRCWLPPIVWKKGSDTAVPAGHRSPPVVVNVSSAPPVLKTIWMEIVVCVTPPAEADGAAIDAPRIPMTAPIRAARMASSF
jgi:hypothetical protein